ncbi:immunoglobulin I-set domain protein [Ancylostoma duodenale]|uniref:Immunoglobulin I-set domain protein n=1 Tax=Ancylostoma duodenale TaxID=51022 RepID=A0A0C2H4T0_9BILA|nr:immunoglobulin I-set domain protein [Ancylostoma duodenale]
MRWLLATIGLIHLAWGQKIVTKGRTITVNEGSQLELPCYVQDLGSESIIWRRKENALFIDEENLAEDERMQVIKDGSNSTLTILDVEPMDMSDYVCAVSEPEQEIVYKIIVHCEFFEPCFCLLCSWICSQLPTINRYDNHAHASH